MQQTQSQKSSWKHKAGAVVVVLIFITVSYFFLDFVDKTYRVKTIRVSMAKGKSLVGLHSLYGVFIPFASEQDLGAGLVSQNPEAESIQVRFKYPDTLEITVSEAVPVAYLKNDKAYILLSKTGRIIRKENAKNRDLPVITYYQRIPLSELAAGNYLDLREISQSLYLIDKLKKSAIIPDTVDIDGRDMVALQIGIKNIYFSSSKESDPQLYQLERIITQFRVEGREYIKIDLRFDRPIIEFES